MQRSDLNDDAKNLNFIFQILGFYNADYAICHLYLKIMASHLKLQIKFLTKADCITRLTTILNNRDKLGNLKIANNIYN